MFVGGKIQFKSAIRETKTKKPTMALPCADALTLKESKYLTQTFKNNLIILPFYGLNVKSGKNVF